jgi:hypothetical protein
MEEKKKSQQRKKSPSATAHSNRMCSHDSRQHCSGERLKAMRMTMAIVKPYKKL